MEALIDLLTPGNIPLWAALLAIVAAGFSAALTAAFGLGGGLALIAVMSAIFPAAAVVPVHGVAQLGSNAGRFYLQRHHIDRQIILWFGLGSLIGALAGGRLAISLPVWVLQSGVAFFILYSIWGPRPQKFLPGTTTFFLTGVIGSFLTMFFGATGPVAATMLSTTKLDRLALTATHAAAMMLQHGLKIAVFGLLGFAYGEWAVLIVAMVLVGFAGTYIGTRFLRKMPEKTFRQGFKVILTTIAIYLFISAIISIRTN